eukprot:31397-Pelagococcus_subviridis.AAC.14
MSSERKLRSALETVCVEHFIFSREAATLNTQEVRAIARIQSQWRSYSIRQQFKRLKIASLRIQTCFRGFCGRKRAHSFSLEASSQLAYVERLKHFHRAATEIQKCWRGSSSRRRIHDFFSRKFYLQSVFVLDQDFRQRMYNRYDNIMGCQLRRETSSRMVDSSVHLASTEVCLGVYDSPFSPAFDNRY